MTVPAGHPTSSVAIWLERGQALEARGEFAAAVAFYDDLLAALPADPPDHATRRIRGVVWMNRGNALQKIPRLTDAVGAYDEAIAIFERLPLDAEPLFRNHLGAAWLNRGHAFVAAADFPAAIRSFEQAISHLGLLPLEAGAAGDPADAISYRLNLAGAWANLAHAHLASGTDRTEALAAARTALALLAGVDRTHEAFAAMSLRTRRALAMTLGELLSRPASAADTAGFLSEASDTIDEGLLLAREWETRGAAHLRPLSARLFRLGAQLYLVYQPQFLAEFLLENVADGPFRDRPEFLAAADDSLEIALNELKRPQFIHADSPASARLLATAVSLRRAATVLDEPHFHALRDNRPPASPDAVSRPA